MLVRSLIGSLMLLMSLPVAVQAQTPAEYKDVEKMAVKLFGAYNKEDAKGVFADYFSALKNQNPEQLYQVLFKEPKAKYGNYKSHQFVKEGSVMTDDIALLVMQVDFAKKKGKVTVNFGKENGKWTIQQVTFADE